MIGNDIIDLKLCSNEEKYQNSRFLQKVFCPSEIESIQASIQPEIMLWFLWSMKEAAYKSHQRIFNLPRKFNPRSFECSLDGSASGKVIIENHSYRTTSIVEKEFIHTCIIPEVNEWSQNIINYSADYRAIIMDKIGAALQISPSALKIEKRRFGIPSLIEKKSGKIFPISLSHHGDFTGFIFPLIKS